MVQPERPPQLAGRAAWFDVTYIGRTLTTDAMLPLGRLQKSCESDLKACPGNYPVDVPEPC